MTVVLRFAIVLAILIPSVAGLAQPLPPVAVDTAWEALPGAMGVQYRYGKRDRDGSLLCGVMVRDTITFGGTRFIVQKYDEDFGVAKFAADGTPLWITPTGYAPWNNLQGFDADPQGNSFALYAAPIDRSRDSLKIGDYRITADGGVVLAKYSPSGRLLWATWLGDSIYAYDVAADGNGGATVAASISGRSIYGADTLDIPGNRRDASLHASAIIRVAPDGSFLWARSIVRKNGAIAFSVASAPNGDIVATGLLLQVDRADTTILGVGRITGPGLYLSRYRDNGDLLWARGLTSGAIELYTQDVAFDSAGSIILAGSLNDRTGQRNFGKLFWDTLGAAGSPLSSYGNDDIFLAKVSGDGKFIWGKVLGGRESDRVANVHIPRDGGIILTGETGGHVMLDGHDHYVQGNEGAFAARYDGDGAPRWVKIYDPRGPGSGNSAGRSVWTLASALDDDDRLWMFGGFSGAVAFDSFTLGKGAPSGLAGERMLNLFGIRLAPGSHTEPPPIWTKIDDGLPYNMHDYGVPDVAALALFGGRLYAGLAAGDAGYWLPNSGGGIYSSTDRGMSWTRNTGGDHPGDSLRYGVVDFAASGDSLYMVTDLFSNSSDHYSKAMVLDRALPGQWSWLKRSGNPDLFGVFGIEGRLYGAPMGRPGLLLWSPDSLGWGALEGEVPSTMSVRLLTGYGEVLLAATWNYQGVYRSTDGGHRWERDSSGIPGIPADEFRGANALATVGTSLYLAAPSGFAPPHPTGVYRSDDAGEHWTPVSDGLPHMAYGSTDSVVVGIEALYAKDGVLFAGCELGIWMLPRGATRWTPVTDDLQQCRVSAMVADDTYLYAALRDCGMWRRPLSTLAMGVGKDRPASPAPSAILGLDVTPNPVTSSARIRFALARPGHVTVSLHDGAGRLLETIADGAMEPGDHALLFDGRGLSSGTYFVRVESGGGSRTVELVYGK